MFSPGCISIPPWGTEVEALRDTMNGNPEGGRKKIQRKAGRVTVKPWALMVTLEGDLMGNPGIL